MKVKMMKTIFLLALTLHVTYAEVQLVTEPKAGEEYVFLQTSAAGSRPVERKEKVSETEQVFETAHKLPPSITYALKESLEYESANLPQKSPKKREANAEPAEPPAPAPAGAIKLDVQKLLEQYKSELKTSTTTSKPKIAKSNRSRATKATTTTTTTTTEATRGRRVGSGRRTKKEAQDDFTATSPNPILTTASSLRRVVDDDLDEGAFLASGSERQRSRIQIKKGPNGQEYEYEYVYYYYDEDEDNKDPPVVNGHDGPAKETAEQSKAKVPEAVNVNEVVPSRSRTRGRQLEEEEIVGEERLPANTRFPPRSRNLNTTPVTEVEEPRRSSDTQTDESQGNRGRTRANVRRPSLDLVDNASFNTHTNSGNANGPSFPSDLPAGPVRFLGATPNERVEIPAVSALPAKEVQQQLTNEDAPKEDITTVMSPMDKVALDLYAILQGTQKLSGEGQQNESDSTEIPDSETTTLEATTEVPTTEPTTPSTTTTTTTTAAPTTESTGFGKGTRFRGRPGISKRPSVSSSTSTEQPQETTKRNRFNRPSFGTRPRSRPTSAPAENNEESTKEDAKPVQSTRTRSRFGSSRTRGSSSTTEAISGDSGSSPSSRPSLRPRPTFNLRGRTKPTTSAADSENSGNESNHEESSTTARSRARISSGSVRPLRPGPRINLGGRGRVSSTAAPEHSAEPAPVVEEDQESAKTEEQETKDVEAAPASDNSNPLTRLRNRQRQPLQVRPKAAASNPVAVRRTNPLLARRKTATEVPSSEAPAAQEISATDAPAPVAEEEASTDPAPSSTTTTEEPKGLNKLLAGRRRLNLRTPGTIA